MEKTIQMLVMFQIVESTFFIYKISFPLIKDKSLSNFEKNHIKSLSERRNLFNLKFQPKKLDLFHFANYPEKEKHFDDETARFYTFTDRSSFHAGLHRSDD